MSQRDPRTSPQRESVARIAPRPIASLAATRPTVDLAALLVVLEPALHAAADAIGDRIAERQAEHAGMRRPHLLDRRELAAHLGVCVDVVDRLRREGCPDLMVGDSVRFELDRVLDWLRVRK